MKRIREGGDERWDGETDRRSRGEGVARVEAQERQRWRRGFKWIGDEDVDENRATKERRRLGGVELGVWLWPLRSWPLEGCHAA